jgi:nitrite reductase/ring-hydroxylating ferredoxin subunit
MRPAPPRRGGPRAPPPAGQALAARRSPSQTGRQSLRLMAPPVGARLSADRSLALHWRPNPQYGVGLGSAWLGGHLVYRERLGVDHAERPEPSDRFARALPLGELPEGRPVRAEVEGVAVVLVRQGAEIHALGDTCAHLGGPLSEGRLEAGAIRCPWHGSEFSLADGSVRHGPATMPQPSWDAHVRDGWVEMRPAVRRHAA